MDKLKLEQLSASLFDKYCIHAACGGPSISRPSFNSAIQEAVAVIEQTSQPQMNPITAALKECREYGYALPAMVVEMIEKALAIAEQASQPPLCEACEMRHWPMQNTLCPATEKTWAGVYKARGYKLVPIVPTRAMMEAGEQSCGTDSDDPYVKRGRFMGAWHDALAAAPENAI